LITARPADPCSAWVPRPCMSVILECADVESAALGARDAVVVVGDESALVVPGVDGGGVLLQAVIPRTRIDEQGIDVPEVIGVVVRVGRPGRS
jgi:hypothetical protein